jgi:cytochrome c-type biogenesis protein CcmH
VTRPRSASGLVLVAAVLVTAAALTWLALRPAPPASLAERTRAVAVTLRCPVCQDLSVADSPSALAGAIRMEIAGRLEQGQTAGEIRSYYVARYGDWILLLPPRSGITLLAWLLPLALLMAGAALVVLAVRRWTRRDGAGAPADDGGADRLAPQDRALLTRALAELEPEPE